jgi:hypothetical protein
VRIRRVILCENGSVDNGSKDTKLWRTDLGYVLRVGELIRVYRMLQDAGQRRRMGSRKAGHVRTETGSEILGWG